MKSLSLLLFAIILIFGCGPQQMTSEKIATEKKAVESQLTKFLDAYVTKDLEAAKSVVSTSSDFLVFGTDSAEVLRNLSDFENQMKNDWQLITSAKHGELKNLSIQLASSGDFASSVCEVPFDLLIGGQSSHALFRFSYTWKKENTEWRFIQGMIAAATVGGSSAELVEKMKISNQ